MMLCAYSSNGSRQVLDYDAEHSDLTKRARALEAREYNVEWDGPNRFEAQRDDEPHVSIYALRPDNWPVRNGEPD